MKNYLLILILSLCCRDVTPRPLRNVHLRQLPPPIEISWTIPLSTSSQASEQANTAPTPFLWQPSISIPSLAGATFVSISTTIAIELETTTTTVYEAPVTVTATVPPATITTTVTVPEPFTATPGSFWSSPPQFSNLDSFKIAHFATGQKNLQITNGIPADSADDSSDMNFMGLDSDSGSVSGPQGSWNSSSALQLFYPQNSINPGNSPQGGADFYATPMPLADASNVTLEYSVFFPKDFDWVRGGKLPGLYGGHMTCSGGDDATSCFSTRLMWREDGAGELYLYAPKDKQTDNLCHAPPESICNSNYGLSIGRGSFKFTAGTWTTIRQTVSLNTPGEHDGGFRLEIDGEQIMNRHDVFYRDIPTTTSKNTTQAANDGDADDGGLLSPIYPLLGPLFEPLNSSGITQGLLSPIIKADSSSTLSNNSLQDPRTDTPPLLSHQQPLSELSANNGSASAPFSIQPVPASVTPTTIIERPTLTQVLPQSTVTVTNYFWEHAFTSAGSEKSILGIGDKADEPKPVGFAGLFFSTFFGGSSKEYATPKDQYTWFSDFSITINS